MRHVRMSSKTLAALLALLMVLSTVIALPVAATDDATATESAKTPLESWNFKEYVNATGTAVSTQLESVNFAAVTGSSALTRTTSTTAPKITGGMYQPVTSNYNLSGQIGTPNFYKLMTGTYTPKSADSPVTSYFGEFDFKFNYSSQTSDVGRSDAATLTFADGSTSEKTIVTNYGYTGGQGYILRFRSNGSANTQTFRVSQNNYLYAISLQTDVKTLATGVDKYMYYTDSTKGTGTVWFDAEGKCFYYKDATDEANDYRTPLPAEEQPTGVSEKSLSLNGVLNPSYIDSAYLIERGKTYRIGIKFDITTTDVTYNDADYTMTTVKETVYVKADGADAWEKCIGTSTQYHYEVGATANATKANDFLEVTKLNQTGIGGIIEFYTYDCTENDHCSFYNAGKGKTKQCVYCGEVTEYEFFDEVPSGFVPTGSQSGVSYSGYTTEANGNGYLLQDGGSFWVMDKNNEKLLGSGKPYVISFDAKFDRVGFSGTKSSQFADLLSVGPDSGNAKRLLQVGCDTDGKNPFIAFDYDFAKDQSRGKKTLTIELDGENGSELPSDPNSTEINRLKEEYGEKYYSTTDSSSTDEESGITTYTRTYVFYNPNVGVYPITLGEWINVQVVVVPCGENANAKCILYINGEYMGMRPADFDEWNSTYTNLRFGPGATRYTTMKYGIDNIGIRSLGSVTEAFTNVNASNTIFSMQFDRYQATKTDSDGSSDIGGIFDNSNDVFAGRFNLGWGDYSVVSHTAHAGTEDETVTSYAYFNHDASSTSAALDVSLTTEHGDTYYEIVENEKYAIDLIMAVEDTEDNRAYFHDDGNSRNVVRLSKYHDSFIKSVLVGLNGNGYTAKGWQLYTKDGSELSPYVAFDENGAPTTNSHLRVVVDEEAGTYSVYVNEQIAYYNINQFDKSETPKEPEYRPFLDKEMSLEGKGHDALKLEKYADYTREKFETFIGGLVYDETEGAVNSLYNTFWKRTVNEETDAVTVSRKNCRDYQYVRFLQAGGHMCVNEASVTLIPDSDVELVGTQLMTANQTENDGFNLRFVFGVDDLYVSSINFSVTAYKNKELHGVATKSITVVHSGVKTGTDSYFYAYECSEGDYFALLRITGIKELEAHDTYTFAITATATDSNGETISENTYTVSCNGQGGNIQTVE